MSNFQWKKKRRIQVCKAFVQDSDEEEEEKTSLPPSKLQKLALAIIEDNETASKRLQQQGVTLAENERYWEALSRWDTALELTPNSAILHEMKSQVQLELGEIFPAVQSAEKAASLDLTWSVARQTLGRAQLGIGELDLALSNFQKGLHLDPTNDEIRNDDIPHVLDLIKERKSMKFSCVSPCHMSTEKESDSPK